MLNLFLRLLILDPFVSFVVSQEIPNTWTQSNAPINQYHTLSSNPSGDFLVAGSDSGYLYKSNDNPLQWTVTICPSQGKALYCSAVSEDGEYIVTGSQYFDPYANSHVYLSTTSASTWTTTNAPNQEAYSGLAMSSDGQYVYATSWCSYTYNYGAVYYSHNYGSSFTSAGMGNQPWNSVACSSDGMYVAVVLTGGSGSIYLSRNYGVSYTKSSAPPQQYMQITVSSNFQYLCATAGDVISCSQDAGMTWFSATPSLSWNQVVSTSSGQLMYATSPYGVYYTEDYGSTWNKLPNQPPSNKVAYCNAIATDGSGSQIIAECFPSFSDGVNGTLWVGTVGGSSSSSGTSSQAGLIAGLVIGSFFFLVIGGGIGYYIYIVTAPSSEVILPSPSVITPPASATPAKITTPTMEPVVKSSDPSVETPGVVELENPIHSSI